MVKTFFTNAAAAEHIITGSNIGHGSHIIQAANGKRKTAYGFHQKNVN